MEKYDIVVGLFLRVIHIVVPRDMHLYVKFIEFILFKGFFFFLPYELLLGFSSNKSG